MQTPIYRAHLEAEHALLTFQNGSGDLAKAPELWALPIRASQAAPFCAGRYCSWGLPVGDAVVKYKNVFP